MKLTAQNAALSETQILDEAKKIGYPVLIKAAMGGGGRGMKIVRKADDLIAALNLARQESRSAFGSEEVYIEKYCEEPRHIEIQVMGDRYGNLRHFGERDCSIQRRHQKLLEEALSPALSPELRAAIGQAGLKAAAAVNYFTAGTVEFLLDTDQRFYFLEMNTRIQVEHPVTEMVTGFDLVREQIKTAIGEKISSSQNDIQFKGHAIECRITAEDPSTFAPSPGRIELFHPPYGRGVRLESCAHNDFFVPPYYDSMIGKLITYDENREFCIRRMKQALKEFVVRGFLSVARPVVIHKHSLPYRRDVE
jgi:acetyl-CoA carboxylase biotin carboxylase subunit